MSTDQQSESERKIASWEEAFKGRDAVLGGELVGALVREGVGLPVISQKLREKKTRVMVDRAPGEEDFDVRQKEEYPEKLLGILIPTSNEHEYAYLGVNESGLIIKEEGEFAKRRDRFNPDSSQPLYLNWDRFVDYWTHADVLGENKIILREDRDPDRFFEIVVASVEAQRQKVQQAKNKMAATRGKLISRLFGQGGTGGL